MKPKSQITSTTEPRRFAIRRQIATFSKAELAAAHSRNGGIASGGTPPLALEVYYFFEHCVRSGDYS